MDFKRHATILRASGKRFVLDPFPASVTAAYSLRRLSSSYTGSAIRAIRLDTLAEQDIGFTATGEFDTAALSSFAGSNSDVRIRSWYDQSGNGLTATQTLFSRQPRLVLNGAIDSFGGSTRPCPVSTATACGMNIAGLQDGRTVTVGTSSLVWADTSARDYTNPCHLNMLSTGGPIGWHGDVASSSSAFSTTFSVAPFLGGTHYSNGTAFTFASPGAVGDRPTTCRTMSLVPTSVASGALDAAGLFRDPRNGSEGRYVDAIWEVILFSTVLSTSDRQSVERNQGIYYGLTIA